MTEKSPFERHLERSGYAGQNEFKKKGHSALALALEKARREGHDPALIAKAEMVGMLDGSLTITYQGAERIYKRVKEVAAKNPNNRLNEILDTLDPVEDHDLIATAYFCMPEVRKAIDNHLESLYRVVLSTGANKRKGYVTDMRPSNVASYEDSLLPKNLEELIRNLPREEFTGEEEWQRRLRVILRKKAEREIFKLFHSDEKKAFGVLEKQATDEKNENLRDAYREQLDFYRAYAGVNVKTANKGFRDPETHELAELPALHQKIAIHHLVEEQKFGIFDGCGTGKTAIAALAQPVIEERLGREARTLVVCPNPAKKVWKKGLTGGDDERYFATVQDMAVVNGDVKDEDFLAQLGRKKWVVVNYEQLPAKVRGSDKLFAERLAEMGFDYVIFDESHHIKNQKTTTASGRPTLSAAARLLGHGAKYLALLTGSPIPDRLEDYAVPFHLLNPGMCPDVSKFRELYEKNPRILYTLFNEKTVRRTSQDINAGLEWDEFDEPVELDEAQRQLYEHIVEFRPTNWLMQARKAILDPRLVDPEILQRAGVFGRINERSSSKYRKLEDLLCDEDGPVAKGEKFVVFSSMFRDGVTQTDNESVRGRYQALGLGEHYEELGLDKPLAKILEEGVERRLGKKIKLDVIDGTITNIEERERRVDSLKDGTTGIICTTETGGESLDFTGANHAYFLDVDYSPKTTDQALARLIRKGQKRKVNITYLTAQDTLDEDLKRYIARKTIINKIATDGHPLTEQERELLNDTEGQQFSTLVKRGLGGISIDVLEVKVEGVDDFTTKVRRSRGSRRTNLEYEYGVTTDAQKVMQWIGKDPQNCWKDPEFVKLYMSTLPNLAVPIVHRAKIADLARRSLEGQIKFPGRVLSDGSGPSLLYDAYEGMQEILQSKGIVIPEIVDRDISALMLAQGKNPNKVVGNMTGQGSTFEEAEFDMVDNESISLLRNPEEVKATVLEAHRVLRPNGLMELIVKNMRFNEGFYEALPKAGFKVLTGRNEGFAVGSRFMDRLRKEKGNHYAESYQGKLQNTHLIIAQKVGEAKKDEIDPEDLWFERLLSEETVFDAMDKKKEQTGEKDEFVARKNMLRRRSRISRESKKHE